MLNKQRHLGVKVRSHLPLLCKISQAKFNYFNKNPCDWELVKKFPTQISLVFKFAEFTKRKLLGLEVTSFFCASYIEHY